MGSVEKGKDSKSWHVTHLVTLFDCQINDLLTEIFMIFLMIAVLQVHFIHKTFSNKGLIQLWNAGKLKVDSAR